MSGPPRPLDRAPPRLDSPSNWRNTASVSPADANRCAQRSSRASAGRLRQRCSRRSAFAASHPRPASPPAAPACPAAAAEPRRAVRRSWSVSARYQAAESREMWVMRFTSTRSEQSMGDSRAGTDRFKRAHWTRCAQRLTARRACGCGQRRRVRRKRHVVGLTGNCLTPWKRHLGSRR